jgi:hypothetical protein
MIGLFMPIPGDPLSKLNCRNIFTALALAKR